MELEELRRRYRADNTFEVARDGVTLELRLIGPLEVPRVAAVDAYGVQVATLRRAVIGWRGIPAAELVEGADGDLPFDPAFTDGVCARHPELALDAFIELARRVEQREERRKNSARTSPTG